MAASSRSIAPLFAPGAPPPPLPLLTFQTDLSNHSCFPKITAHEELAPVKRKKDQTVRNKVKLCAPIPARSLQPALPPRTTPINLTRHATPGPSSTDKDTNLDDASSSSSSSDLSDLTSESTSDDSDDSDGGKIPKPPGEAGRPGRGGYNLEDTLNWNKKSFKKLKKCIHQLVDDHLDVTQTISAQSLAQLQAVRDQALDKIPDLNSYSHGWPATDLIRMRLHYTSNRHRRGLRQISGSALTGRSAVIAGKAGKRKRSTVAKI